MTGAISTAPWLLALMFAASLEPQELRVHPEGIGPVRAGMTVAEAEKTLGLGLLAEGPLLPAEVDEESSADFEACHYAAAPELPGLGFMVEAGRITRVDVFDGSYRTPEGAGIGSTEAEVRRMYPRLAVQVHPYSEAGHSLIVEAGAGELLFETDGQVVTSFRSGASRSVAYVEGCL